MFADISHFTNTSDYLPILVAVIIVDLIVVAYILSPYSSTKTLRLWYKKFTYGAFISDILSIFIGIIISLMMFFIIYGADIPIIVRFLMFLFILYIVYNKLVNNKKN